MSFCIEEARSGRPRVVWVEGVAGVGKTAFARRVLAMLPAEAGVARAVSDAVAVDVRLAVVDQLAAVSARSPFAAGLELLDRLGGLQQNGLGVVLVEDLHWCDPDSRQALLTMAQRLDNDRMVMVVTSRPNLAGGEVDGWVRLRSDLDCCVTVRLSGFTVAEVAELAEREQVPLLPPAAARLHAHTGGHPLYVRTLLRELTPAQLADAAAKLPVPQSLASVTMAVLARLSADARRLAETLAVVNRRVPLVLAGRIGGVSDPAAALEELLPSGLVGWQPHEDATPVELAHPLYQMAIYGDLSPTVRRRLHRAAAEVSDAAAALAHRVASADTMDDGLADELEAAANDPAEPVSVPTKAKYLRWASTLTSRRDQRERRLLDSARCLLSDKHFFAAADLRTEVEACQPCPLRNVVLGMFAWSDGDSAAALKYFEAASSPVAADADPHSAAFALFRLANVYINRMHVGQTIEAANRGLALVSPGDDLSWDLRSNMALAIMQEYGDERGFDTFSEWFSTPPERVGVLDANLLVTRALLGHYAGAVEGPIADLRAALFLAQRGAAVPGLVRAHLHLSQLLFRRGDWNEALIQGRVALSLLTDNPFVWEEAQVHAAVAVVLVARGDLEAAASHMTAAETAATRARLPEAHMMVLMARASLARAQGRPFQLVAALRPLTGDRRALPVLTGLGWWPVLISALIEEGELDDAERELAAFQAAVAHRRLNVDMSIAFVEAQLAAARKQPAAATEWFDRALTLANADQPLLERALLLHAAGRHRMAIRDRRGAISNLQAARQLLEPLGAEPYIRRVDVDLRASGIRRSDNAGPLLQLTDREQSVAVLVTRGLSNRETAAQLYISEKAVEYHLHNIYGKLGISSRRKLTHHLAVTPFAAPAR